jgi:hypothetical protein
MSKKKAFEYGKKEIIILVVIAIIGLSFFAYKEGLIFAKKTTTESTSLLSVELYHSNGSLANTVSSQMLSVVGGYTDLTAAKFKVTVVNKGNVPVTVTISDARPSELYNNLHLPMASRTILPNGTGQWISDPISLSQYGNRTRNVTIQFGATVNLIFEDKKGTEYSKNGTVTLTIDQSDILVNETSNTNSTVSQCDTVTCENRCEGIHQMKNGNCYLQGNLTYCDYSTIDWYATACTYDITTTSSCGDGTCNGNECCYISDNSRSAECKTGAALCTYIFNNSCNLDCKNPGNINIKGAITFGD